MTFLSTLKGVLPDRVRHLRVLRGPFRGGVFIANPRVSMRKVLGLYEHELNGWLDAVLPQASAVLDVGANDGYFTFGCAAAFARLGAPVRIVAFEPLKEHRRQLQGAKEYGGYSDDEIRIVERPVGRGGANGTVILDDFAGKVVTTSGTLIKIDVEGAEMDVVAGATRWCNPDNFFLIEVQRREFLDKLESTFGGRGVFLDRIEQKPLPVLGWLVSRLR